VSPLGFGPLQRLPDGGQPPVPGNPSPQLVASSGFRDLLTPCSAHHLPALFHAGPAPGVHPSEHCSSPRSRTPSPAPRPSCRCCRAVHPLFAEPTRGSIVERATCPGTPPSGVGATRESGTKRGGLGRAGPWLSWVSPLQGAPPRRLAAAFTATPLLQLPPALAGDRRCAAPGYFSTTRLAGLPPDCRPS
jgi:hypothetical protein